MSRAPMAALALGLSLFAPPIFAQVVSGQYNLLQHMSKGLAGTQVGDFATYRVYGGLEGRESFWRVAIVGEQKDALGRDARWVELEMGQHHLMKAPLMQARLLVAQDVKEGEQAVTRMYLGWGMEKVREVSPATLKDLFNTPMPRDDDLHTPEIRAEIQKRQPKGNLAEAKKKMSVRTLPERRLMTLAGTVSAVPTEVRYASTLIKRIWVSRDVPVLHLAKLEIPAIEHSIEVRDYGRNAKPEMILPIDGSPLLTLEDGWESVFKPVVLDEIQEQKNGASHGNGP